MVSATCSTAYRVNLRIWAAFLVAYCLWPFGVAAETRWSALGVQDGLLSATVHSLQALPEGRMLIGTSRGLNEWDGQRLVGHSAGHGVAPGRITSAVMHGGEIWAASWGGGLSVLRDGAWRTLQADQSSLPGDWISALAAAEDALWVATYGGGLALLEEESWQVYTRSNSNLPSDWLTALAVDRGEGLWIGTERAGLAHRDAEGHWALTDLPFEGQTEVTALLADGDTIWVGTPRGLGILDVVTSQWRAATAVDRMLGEYITALASGTEGQVWIGTARGLAVAQGDRFTKVEPDTPFWHPAVSALAIDSSGALWAGGPVRGIAKQGTLNTPEISRLPIMLVHGWRGPDSDLLRDSEFWHLASWLKQDGFRPHYVAGISPENTLHQNGARLRDAIAKVRQETGAEQVYLVAFSMGGLNSRAYLESTLYGQDVRRAFILGTPHRGEHLWLPFLAWERLAWTAEPSAAELYPIHARLFARTHSNSWNVPYTVIAGDARGEALPTLFKELPASDGLVSTWSALGVQGPRVTRHVSTDIHAWSGETILLDLPSLLLPRATYDAFIRPYLFDAADLGADDLVAHDPGVRSVVGDVDYPEVQLPARTGFRTAQVGPGETVSLAAWPIDETGRVRFYARWNGPPLNVRLRAPDGVEIDPDVTLENADLEYLALGFADFASYVVTDTLPGPWQMIAESDAKDSEATELVAFASLDSPLRLSVDTDRQWYAPGEALDISVLIRDPAAKAKVSTVSCTIYAPNGRRETIRLSADLQATPGRSIWRGRHELPARSGYYALDCRALGTRMDQRFERSELAIIGVTSQSALLAGTPTLLLGRSPREEGQDSRARVVVSAKVAGDYMLSIALGNPEGAEPVSIAHPVHLSSGEHTISVPIPLDAPDLTSLGAHIELLNIALLDISDAGLLADTWASERSFEKEIRRQ